MKVVMASLRKAMLLASALALTALLLELALTLAGWPAGSPVRVVPGKGVTFVPGAAYVHRKEGYSEGRFNAHGFRDRERTWEKPEGTYRILVLGDSYVEAMQVPLEESFPYLMEDALRSRRGTGRYEVLALGQSGFGTTESLVRYRNFGRHYRPDLVLLAVTTANDLRNNHKTLNGEAIGHYYVRDEHGDLVLDDSLLRAYERSLGPVKQAYTWLRQRSRLVGLVSERLQLLRRQWRVQGGEDGAAPDGVLEPGSDLNIYVEDAGPLWAEATEITHDVLLMAATEVAHDGARLAVVSLTNAEQVHTEIGAALQSRLNGVLDFGRPERLLEHWCGEAGIPYLPLLPAFQQAYEESGADLHGFGERRTGHWNQAGHRLAASAILAFLDRNALLEPPGQSDTETAYPETDGVMP